MPVSNPSEFPPHRAGDQIIGLESGKNHIGGNVFLAGQSAGDNSTISDLILIGHLAGSSGWTDANMAGSLVIGSNALPVLGAQFNQLAGPNTVVGCFAAQLMVNMGASVVIGDHALSNAVGSVNHLVIPNANNVVIGSAACEFTASSSTSARLNESVVIGANAAKGIPGAHDIITSVLIGAECCPSISNSVASVNNTIIGYQGGGSGFGAAGTVASVVAIGAGCSGGNNASNSVFIGANQTYQNGAVLSVAIGDSIASSGFGNCVTVGAQASAGGGAKNIILGSAAGSNDGTFSETLIIETGNLFDAPTPLLRLIFGDFSTGCLVLGDSSKLTGTGVVPTGGLNTVSLVNGTKGAAGANPNGYFYVDSVTGLHWVGTSGTDTILALQ